MWSNVNWLTNFEKQSPFFHIALGFALIGGIGLIDFLTGYELALSVFYVLPIALITWFTWQWLGLVASLTSAFVWLTADLATGHPYSYPLIPAWNSFIRLAFFVLITSLLSALRNAAVREKELARLDHLTGAVNSRHFHELAQMEMDRFQRYNHPFTLAYIDLDNFKQVNDQFGHSVGNDVLQRVVRVTKSHLRKTDVLARLGGDEFALLLPETNPEAARVALSKIQANLLEAMRQSHWPITFSIGVLTCRHAPQTIDALVRMADELMYAVKHGSKNAIKYATYAG